MTKTSAPEPVSCAPSKRPVVLLDPNDERASVLLARVRAEYEARSWK